jgi:hypothetical protein
MPLAVTVTLLVLGVTAIVAVAGYLIHKSEEREERKEFSRVSQPDILKH